MKHSVFVLTIFFWTIRGMSAYAQPAGFQTLMDEAKGYFQQKEYEKSNECYEKVVDILRGTDGEHLIPTVRNGMAINYLYMGVAALKEKNYPDAKEYLENAIRDAKPESKTCYMAHSWMGQWYSVQALNIRSTRGDMQQAVKLSMEAEKFFDLAKAPDKRLKEQLARASALRDLARNDEAETLLKQIITECTSVSERNVIRGKACFNLGVIELETERFQPSLQHLEQSYDLCNGGTTKDAKSYAYLAANRLYQLYSNQIPDSEKALLWKQRSEELSTVIE